MKNTVAISLIATISLLLTGCTKEVDKITSSIDHATQVLDRTGYTIDQNMIEATGLLSSALAYTKDGTLRRELQLTIDHLKQATTDVPLMTVDFVRARVREDLDGLRASITGGKIPDKVPFVGAVSPQIVRYTSSKEHLLILGGWNLDHSVISKHFKLSVVGDNTERGMPSETIHSVTPYRLILRFTPGTSSGLMRGDNRIVGHWKGNPIFEIPVIPPPQTRATTIKVVSNELHQSDPVSLVPNYNGKVGDWDLRSEDRRPNPPRCHQSAKVSVSTDKTKLYLRINVEFNEALPDYTLLKSDSAAREIFRLLPNGPEVMKARIDLNLSDEYEAAVPEIDSIISAKEGSAYLPEYTYAMDEHKENGCVENWYFYGDQPGDDRNVKVVVRLKPIELKIAFHMPDAYVTIKIPQDSKLNNGVPLR